MINKNKKTTAFVIVLLLTVVFGYFVLKNENPNTLGETESSFTNVRGIIVPHHDLVDSLIIGSIEGLKEENEYDHIIILGPNHFYPESPTIMSSYTYKNYMIDEEIIRTLENSIDNITINKEKMENEHSSGVPIKYFAEAFPNAKFIPIAVSPFYSDETLNQTATILSNISDDKTLFVLSIDFAHNLTIDEALDNNEESINAIKGFDYSKILSFDDRHLDSPVGTVLFLKIMEMLESKNWTTLNSTHGSIIEGESDLNGTSYVLGVFKE